MEFDVEVDVQIGTFPFMLHPFWKDRMNEHMLTNKCMWRRAYQFVEGVPEMHIFAASRSPEGYFSGIEQPSVDTFLRVANDAGLVSAESPLGLPTTTVLLLNRIQDVLNELQTFFDTTLPASANRPVDKWNNFREKYEKGDDPTATTFSGTFEEQEAIYAELELFWSMEELRAGVVSRHTEHLRKKQEKLDDVDPTQIRSVLDSYSENQFWGVFQSALNAAKISDWSVVDLLRLRFKRFMRYVEEMRKSKEAGEGTDDVELSLRLAVDCVYNLTETTRSPSGFVHHF
eukprot:TRINITY_DN1764_c0_g2_i3.p2 TRINITY_DN1764_c0_g2~~TRINITY_DN1764_c0_g2_i3.p2  ORF type:complete len:287 (+),score=45.35 TRINITY_DN1764_c0_g2_i3:625-1485(+)